PPSILGHAHRTFRDSVQIGRRRLLLRSREKSDRELRRTLRSLREGLVVIGNRIGPYEVFAKLGEGGMGEVYRARDTRLDPFVALKLLPAAVATVPDRLARFEREARAASALNHPAIVTIY